MNGYRARAALVLVAGAGLLLASCGREPVAATAPAPAERPAGQEVRYSPGVPAFGSNQYVEYIPGTLPLIFTAPHGGSLTPGGIADRTDAACGATVVTLADANTEDLARAIQAAFRSRTGQYPHVVVNRLHRSKLDANRPLGEAACGNPLAAVAWEEYHRFIEVAKARVLADHGRGWYTDLHGHAHQIPRLELGYDLSASTLRRTDTELDAGAFEAASTIRTFSERSPLPFSALLRGPTGLGTLFARAGFPATPSQQEPAPAVADAYFSGGYNTERHACKSGGQICGVQIEAPRPGVRDSAANRARFAAALVEVYREYLGTNFGILLPAP